MLEDVKEDDELCQAENRIEEIVQIRGSHSAGCWKI
jgi:hypothetical protein